MTTRQQALTQILCKITQASDMDKFLNDILTPAEYQDIATRVHILSLAKQGKSASEISKSAGVWLSTAQRWINVYQKGTGICTKIL